eukprot:m51a1_g12341 hypothetical protein (464) ;mRNA; f:510629-512610
MSTCWCPAYEPNVFQESKCRNCRHPKECHPHEGGCTVLINTALLSEKDDERRVSTPTQQEADRHHRGLVARELVTTERTYLAAIERAVYEVLRPARDSGALTPEEALAIFSNIESLVMLHREVLANLERQLAGAQSGFDLTGFGSVFVKLGPMLRVYKEYSSNYGEALKTIDHTLRTRHEWVELCRQCMEAPEADTPSITIFLTSYLIQPIQRIPRYVLLLNDMLKHTPKMCDDRKKLKKALALLNEIAAEVNQYMKRAEQGSKALEIQQHLIGSNVPSLLEAHRYFVMEATFSKITSRFVRSCTLFLFNDLVLYVHTRVGSFCKLQGVIELGPAWARGIDDTETYKNLWQIVAPKKTWTFYAQDAETRDLWVREMNRLSDEIASKTPGVREKRAQVNVKVRTGFWRDRSLSQRSKFDKEFAQKIAQQGSADADESTKLLSDDQKSPASKQQSEDCGCCCCIL